MKPLLALLALSLAANAILFLSRPKPSATATSAPPPTAAVEKPSDSTTPSLNSQPSSLNSPSSVSVSSSPHAALWEKLRSGDPSTVTALRAAGWPDDAIRLLVESLVQDAYRDRFKALWPSGTVTEYWRQDALYNRSTPEQRKASLALNREMHALLKSLLGPDYTPDRSSSRDPRYERVTPAQAESLRMIEEDYNVLLAEARGNSSMIGRTILLPEDREKIRFLEKEKSADIAKVLPPSELLEYELRHSQAASNLRNNFAGLRPTEEEFRALFPLQKAMLEKIGGPTLGYSPADRELREQAQREMDEAAKAVLSPERYAEYTRAKDYEYGRLVTLADRLQLPPASASAAYDIKADIEKRTRELRPSGPDAMKTYNAARAELAAEAEKRLLDTLGPRGLEAYKANGAYWLTNLTPSSSAR